MCKEIVLNREPDAVYSFASRVAADFAFTSIVPAHFDAPLTAGPADWLRAFDVFSQSAAAGAGPLPDADLAFLRQFERQLVASGTIRPRPQKS